MWHFIVTQYHDRIAANGRQPLFLLLVGTVLSFLFIRFSVRMIRARVRWWPGNVAPGGLHIHHMVFGIGLLIAAGGASFTNGGNVGHWRDVLAFLFGVGVGLVLDEFALILHLKDVYWTSEGRKSVNAVILAIALLGLALLGEAPLGGISRGDPGWIVAIGFGACALLVVVSLLKGKLWTGLIGIMLPIIALVGAVRLGRPGSPWARWRYTRRPRRLARAQRREDGINAKLARVRVRVFDAVAGAPSLSTGSDGTGSNGMGSGGTGSNGMGSNSTGSGSGDPRGADRDRGPDPDRAADRPAPGSDPADQA